MFKYYNFIYKKLISANNKRGTEIFNTLHLKPINRISDYSKYINTYYYLISLLFTYTI
jgi:hypothetical protein